jgi:hypothetical protein
MSSALPCRSLRHSGAGAAWLAVTPVAARSSDRLMVAVFVKQFVRHWLFNRSKPFPASARSR